MQTPTDETKEYAIASTEPHIGMPSPATPLKWGRTIWTTTTRQAPRTTVASTPSQRLSGRS